MARIQAQQIAYAFEKKIEYRLRSLKVPRPKSVAEDLVPLLIDEIPPEAFDPKEAWEQGFLFLGGDIEEKSVRDMQSDIITAHVNMKPDVALMIHINSVGGFVYDGLALTSTIHEVQRRGRVVNIHVQGVAMSMASVLLQAGNHRSIEPYGFLMLHEERYGMDGSLTEQRDQLAFSERIDDACSSLYSARTGKPVEYYKKKWERKDWHLSAREALDEGLVDEIKQAPVYPRHRRKKPA